jgi:hypothetical protein
VSDVAALGSRVEEVAEINILNKKIDLALYEF